MNRDELREILRQVRAGERSREDALHTITVMANRPVETTDEMIDAALGSSYGFTTLHDVGDPYFKRIHRDIVRAALEAALSVAPYVQSDAR